MDTTGDGSWSEADWESLEDWRMDQNSVGCWTPDDRARYNLLALEAAWNNEGPQPWYHRQVKRWLERRWSVLYYAIEKVVADVARQG